MDATEYLTVWAAYLGASVTFLVLWWFFTARISNVWLKVVLRVPVLPLLLTPLQVSIHNVPMDTVYSPAIAAFCIDLIAGHVDRAMHTLPYLSAAVVLSLLLGWLYVYCFCEKKRL